MRVLLCHKKQGPKLEGVSVYKLVFTYFETAWYFLKKKSIQFMGDLKKNWWHWALVKRVVKMDKIQKGQIKFVYQLG